MYSSFMVALLKEKRKKMMLLFFIRRKFENCYNNIVSHYILYAMRCKDLTNSSHEKKEVSEDIENIYLNNKLLNLHFTVLKLVV